MDPEYSDSSHTDNNSSVDDSLRSSNDNPDDYSEDKYKYLLLKTDGFKYSNSFGPPNLSLYPSTSLNRELDGINTLAHRSLSSLQYSNTLSDELKDELNSEDFNDNYPTSTPQNRLSDFSDTNDRLSSTKLTFSDGPPSVNYCSTPVTKKSRSSLLDPSSNSPLRFNPASLISLPFGYNNNTFTKIKAEEIIYPTFYKKKLKIGEFKYDKKNKKQPFSSFGVESDYNDGQYASDSPDSSFKKQFISDLNNSANKKSVYNLMVHNDYSNNPYKRRYQSVINERRRLIPLHDGFEETADHVSLPERFPKKPRKHVPKPKPVELEDKDVDAPLSPTAEASDELTIQRKAPLLPCYTLPSLHKEYYEYIAELDKRNGVLESELLKEMLVTLTESIGFRQKLYNSVYSSSKSYEQGFVKTKDFKDHDLQKLMGLDDVHDSQKVRKLGELQKLTKTLNLNECSEETLNKLNLFVKKSLSNVNNDLVVLNYLKGMLKSDYTNLNMENDYESHVDLVFDIKKLKRLFKHDLYSISYKYSNQELAEEVEPLVDKTFLLTSPSLTFYNGLRCLSGECNTYKCLHTNNIFTECDSSSGCYLWNDDNDTPLDMNKVKHHNKSNNDLKTDVNMNLDVSGNNLGDAVVNGNTKSDNGVRDSSVCDVKLHNDMLNGNDLLVPNQVDGSNLPEVSKSQTKSETKSQPKDSDVHNADLNTHVDCHSSPTVDSSNTIANTMTNAMANVVNNHMTESSGEHSGYYPKTGPWTHDTKFLYDVVDQNKRNQLRSTLEFINDVCKVAIAEVRIPKPDWCEFTEYNCMNGYCCQKCCTCKKATDHSKLYSTNFSHKPLDDKNINFSIDTKIATVDLLKNILGSCSCYCKCNNDGTHILDKIMNDYTPNNDLYNDAISWYDVDTSGLVLDANKRIATDQIVQERFILRVKLDSLPLSWKLKIPFTCKLDINVNCSNASDTNTNTTTNSNRFGLQGDKQNKANSKLNENTNKNNMDDSNTDPNNNTNAPVGNNAFVKDFKFINDFTFWDALELLKNENNELHMNLTTNPKLSKSNLCFDPLEIDTSFVNKETLDLGYESFATDSKKDSFVEIALYLPYVPSNILPWEFDMVECFDIVKYGKSVDQENLVDSYVNQSSYSNYVSGNTSMDLDSEHESDHMNNENLVDSKNLDDRSMDGSVGTLNKDDSCSDGLGVDAHSLCSHGEDDHNDVNNLAEHDYHNSNLENNTDGDVNVKEDPNLLSTSNVSLVVSDYNDGQYLSDSGTVSRKSGVQSKHVYNESTPVQSKSRSKNDKLNVLKEFNLVTSSFRKVMWFMKLWVHNRNRFIASEKMTYEEYKRFWHMHLKTMPRSDVDVFSWGVLPVRALDLPDTFIPLPAGYKHNDISYPYLKQGTTSPFHVHGYGIGDINFTRTKFGQSDHHDDLHKNELMLSGTSRHRDSQVSRRKIMDDVFGAKGGDPDNPSRSNTYLIPFFSNLTGPSVRWTHNLMDSLKEPVNLIPDFKSFPIYKAVKCPEMNLFGLENLMVYDRKNVVSEQELMEDELNYRLSQVWTKAEVRTFVEKYLMYPKNFTKIAQFLENKKCGDCVEFYYRFKYRLKLKQGLYELRTRAKAKFDMTRHLKREACIINALDSVLDDCTTEIVKIFNDRNMMSFNTLSDYSLRCGSIDSSQVYDMLYTQHYDWHLASEDDNQQTLDNIAEGYFLPRKYLSMTTRKTVSFPATDSYDDLSTHNRKGCFLFDYSSYDHETSPIKPRSDFAKSMVVSINSESFVNNRRRGAKRVSLSNVDKILNKIDQESYLGQSYSSPVETLRHSDDHSNRMLDFGEVKEDVVKTDIEDDSPSNDQSQIYQRMVTRKKVLTHTRYGYESPKMYRQTVKHKSKKKPSKWTNEEKHTYYEVLGTYGKDWNRLYHAMAPFGKTMEQIKNYYHKNNIKIRSHFYRSL